MNTDTQTLTENNDQELDILSRLKIGIDQVKESGVSFDIELSEEEYNQYKESLTAVSTTATSINLPSNQSQNTDKEVEAPTLVKTQKIEHATAKCAAGENIYSILIRELDLNTKVPRLGSRYNAIENILASVRVSPTLYGITSGDITKPNTGDIIDLDKINTIIAETSIAEKNIIDHANSLPDIVVQGIEEYMPTDAREALMKAPIAVKSDSLKTPTILNNPNGDHTLEAGDVHLLLEGDIYTELSNMTELEAKMVSKSLLTEMKLQSIPWSEVLTVGAESVNGFIEKTGKTFVQDKISNLLKIHQIKTEVSAQENTTILEYFQKTTLAKIRKN